MNSTTRHFATVRIPLDADTAHWNTEDERWDAVTHRDRDADGAFFYAVRTTGVFCRPSCASRQPRRENVAFFTDAATARAAGFRDCKRCQPGGLLGVCPCNAGAAKYGAESADDRQKKARSQGAG